VTNNALWDVIARRDITYESLAVLAHMLKNAKRNNRFEGTRAHVAQALDMHGPHVSRAWKELREAGLILRITEPEGKTFWYVDARRAFRGSAERHARELERQAKQRNKDRKSNVIALNA